ncbi:MAG: amidase, partial [Cytophagaceae bacterium]
MKKYLLCLFAVYAAAITPSGAQSFKTKHLQEATIASLHDAMQAGKVTAEQLVQLYLDRIEAYDKQGPYLNAIIMVNPKALTEARRLDSLYKATGKLVGPLHGIPYGLKDLFAVKGYKTTWGSTPYKDQVIGEDSYVYTQLKKAGAVLCAKLSLGALAYNNKWFGGETKNPWDLVQGSSGSSAGSAASVVAGLLPFT